MQYVAAVAELALQSASLQQFNREFVRATTHALRAEGGVILAWSPDGCATVACDILPGDQFARELALGSAEFTEEEARLSLSSGATTPASVFSPARRENLQFFRAGIVPHLPSVFRIWVSRDTVSFFGFLAPSWTRHERFRERAIGILNDVFPVVALTNKLFASTRDADLPRALTLDLKLTVMEHESMSLVLRGLTNPEIAQVLGISLNTVRNHIASCFKKLGVSTRTEAIYVLNNAKCAEHAQPGPLFSAYDRTIRVVRSRLD